MPNGVPIFADIYGIDKLVLVGGDAHKSLRPCAVVHSRSDVVTMLGRSSTAKHEPGVTLESAIDLGCKLDKPGVFSVRFQHSVATPNFENPRLCKFFGHLGSTAEAELLSFWQAHVYG